MSLLRPPFGNGSRYVHLILNAAAEASDRFDSMRKGCRSGVVAVCYVGVFCVGWKEEGKDGSF